ncbi:MAG: cytochrome c3 family protein, partial [Candidatus Eisenbacteria bacterium]
MRRWLERPLARRILALALVGAALGGLVAAGTLRAMAARPQPGRARTCYDCHPQAKGEFQKKKVVHAPVAKNDCASCHQSHGFSQRLVLTKAPPELCFDCHGDLKKAPVPAHAHEAFAKGQCLGCHDPHASDQARLVRDGGPAATCFDCHATAKAEAQAAVVHAPFKQGDCAGCHAAHGGAVAGLLKAEPAALCATCHAPAAMTAKHASVVRGDLACLDCHAAHASGEKKLLRAGAHPPVAEGQCESCHEMSGGQPTAKLVAAVPGLCATCHGDKTGLDAR